MHLLNPQTKVDACTCHGGENSTTSDMDICHPRMETERAGELKRMGASASAWKVQILSRGGLQIMHSCRCVPYPHAAPGVVQLSLTHQQCVFRHTFVKCETITSHNFENLLGAHFKSYLMYRRVNLSTLH